MFGEMISMSDLGKYLLREFDQRGWSMRAAAREIGMSFTTLHGVVNGAGTPELPTLRKLADGLKVPLRRLQELAGFVLDDGEPKADPLYGLNDEQRDFLRSLSPEKKAAVIDLARRMLEQ